ncbi:hypothetical protein C5C03_00540 [Clavibacter michiganensis]|nr:hypothetical protein C5C03_00540 [Clavibacter michiganensis]PPF99385.1 hypothetical protein C5C05_02340 [Clavibacter michiganensis]
MRRPKTEDRVARRDPYEAYIDICAELRLTPAERQIFVVASGGVDEAHASMHLLGTGHVTWALLRTDERDACMRCLSTIPAFLDHHYGTGSVSGSRETGAPELVRAFHNLHDLSLAVTTAYASQDWSCVRPVAGCANCSTRVRSFSPPPLLVTEEGDARAVGPNDDDESCSAQAADFVMRHRWAFGFASIAGNPIAVRRSRGVSLAIAPVRSDFDPERCHVASGKGATEIEALASCLGAAIERHALTREGNPAIVLASAMELERTVDIDRKFDLTGGDAPLAEPYSSAIPVDWIPALDVLEGTVVYLPAALALHPYRSAGASVVAATTADGASCRPSALEALHRGLREVVERDAFRYYVRTDALPTPLGAALIPPDVREAMAEVDGRFSVTLLDNPFDAPVVSVTVVTGKTHLSRASCGSAFGSTLASSVREAFIECMALLYALDHRIAASRSETDMRNLWFTGAAVDALPGLFPDVGVGVQATVEDLGLHEVHTLRQLLLDAEAQGMSIYDIPLVDEPGIAVHKVVVSGTSVAETTCRTPSRRLTSFAMLLGHPVPRLRYGGPVDMHPAP